MSLVNLLNRVMNKVADDSNRIMMADAEILVQELKEECPKRTGTTAASMRILGREEGMRAGIDAGFITKVKVGSTLKSAYWADQGNDPGGGVIVPSRKKALAFDGWGSYAGKGHGKNGKYVLPAVSAYEGDHYVTRVANKHR